MAEAVQTSEGAAPAGNTPAEGTKAAEAPAAAPSLINQAPAEGAAPAEGTKAAEPTEAQKTAAAAAKTAFEAATDPAGKKAAFDTLSAEDKKAAFEAMSEEDRKAAGITDPSKIVYDLKLPDGFTVDEASMAEAKKLFEESGLPADQAQKFMDLYAAKSKEAALAGLKAWTDLQEKWTTEIKADPDIGGPKLEASVATAARAIDWVKVPGLKEALDMTGAGNNPAIVKAFVRFGQAISEDRFAAGNGSVPDTRSQAERLYDGQPKGAAA